LFNVGYLVRQTSELPLPTSRRLQADIMLGVCPVNADVGRELAVFKMVHAPPPDVIPLG
jgi:hypothetical protein